MKPFKNKLAVTIVVLSVAFLGIITFSIKSNSTIISSGVGGVISPLQKIVYVVNEKVKESFEFFNGLKLVLSIKHTAFIFYGIFTDYIVRRLPGPRNLQVLLRNFSGRRAAQRTAVPASLFEPEG